MKKISCFLFLLVLCVSIFAKGSSDTPKSTSPSSSKTTATNVPETLKPPVVLNGPWPQGFTNTSNPHETKPGYYEYPASQPPSNSVDDNIDKASTMKKTDFYNAVRNGGAWDYKQQDRSYENLGNFNYGATGKAAGFSSNILERAAGVAQQKAGTSDPSWSTPTGKKPYGDDPADNHWINQGIQYYNIYK